ncbi:hypothetical protein F4804DRAFT_352760 [Jackrogersella minutella]|nr:hypothetical protein F4804DRAFT_352760 [Jackrogersella minutella]
MDHDHVVTIDLEKEEYGQSSQDSTPSTTPPSSDDGRSHDLVSAASVRSCPVCRKTLLLSYFNCCAVCLGIIECGRARKGERPALDLDSLPTVEPRATSPAETPPPSPSSSSSSINYTRSSPPHCGTPYCRYTHARALMALFVLCELVPALGGLAVLHLALYRHDFALLRFAGLLLLQWWQIFVLPRQWACGRSIVAGQLVACLFMVWFYVDGSRAWRW